MGKVGEGDDAGAAADTIISAQSVNTPNATYSVVSGADGTFRFDKLAPDTYKVSAMLGTPMRGMTFYSKQVKVVEHGAIAAAQIEHARALGNQRGQRLHGGFFSHASSLAMRSKYAPTTPR